MTYTLEKRNTQGSSVVASAGAIGMSPPPKGNHLGHSAACHSQRSWKDRKQNAERTTRIFCFPTQPLKLKK